MRVRIPFRSPPQDDPAIDSDSYEDGQSQSVEWVFAHLHLDRQAEDDFDEDETGHSLERRTPWLSRVAMAAVVLVVLGAGGLFALSELRGRSPGGGSGTDRVLTTAQMARSSPLPALSAPETNPLPTQAVVENVVPLPQTTLPSLSASTAAPEPMASTARNSVTSPLPVVAASPKAIGAVSFLPALSGPVTHDRAVSPAGTTEAALTVPSAPEQHTDAAPLPQFVPATPEPALTTRPTAAVPAPDAQAPGAPLPTKLAALAPRTVATPAGVPFTIRLSFTADQSGRAAAFARQLRREGFKVTSAVVPVIHGRWPGVAFFFNSDRERARLIARQLASVTGLNEHARLSPRHPYPKPGIVEVALLRTAKAGSGTSEKRAHTHRLP